MGSDMRYLLLVIGACILIAILWDAIRKKQRQRFRPYKEKAASATQAPLDDLVDDVILLPPRQVKPVAVVEVEEAEVLPASAPEPEKVSEPIILTLRANGDGQFGGFRLLQILMQHGFANGKDRLFHFHEEGAGQGKVVFSLASATPEGTFDLTHMARFYCKGLVLYLDPEEHPWTQENLNLMIKMAEALAQAFDATVYLHQRPLDAAGIASLQTAF